MKLINREDAKQEYPSYTSIDKRRRLQLLLISICLTIVLLGLVLSQLNFHKFERTLVTVRLEWVAGAVGAMLIYQFFRAARMRVLIDRTTHWIPLYATMCIQMTLAKLLPMWLGEIAMIWLLRKFHNVQIHIGTAGILLARFVDLALFSITLLAVIALSVAGERLEIIWIALALLTLVGVAAGGWAIAEHFQPRIGRYAGQAGGRKIFKQLADHFVRLLEAIRAAAEKRNLLPLIFYSTSMWVAMWIAFLCYVRALGSQLDTLEVLFLYVLVFPMDLLPVRGVANLGTHEAIWFLALTAIGMPGTNAATLAVGSHILIFIVTGILFIVGNFCLMLNKYVVPDADIPNVKLVSKEADILHRKKLKENK
jgi:uncharacterized protein (TIRG00374 family)